jgi:DNA-binding XRE family transcriptional regulator
MKNWLALKAEQNKHLRLKRGEFELEPEYRLAEELIAARLHKRSTQSELAQKAGVKQAYIARLEGGTGNPTIATVNKVARVLGKRLKLVGLS